MKAARKFCTTGYHVAACCFTAHQPFDTLLFLLLAELRECLSFQNSFFNKPISVVHHDHSLEKGLQCTCFFMLLDELLRCNKLRQSCHSILPECPSVKAISLDHRGRSQKYKSDGKDCSYNFVSIMCVIR